MSPRAIVTPGLLAVTIAASGCATSSSSLGAPGSTAKVHRTQSAASCAVSPVAAIRRAPTVFVAISLAGPSRAIGSARVLTSPARMQVLRYMKGHGPQIVGVETGVSQSGRIAEDGIVPHQGERWRVVSNARRAPFATSICLGSRRLAPLVMGSPARTPS